MSASDAVESRISGARVVATTRVQAGDGVRWVSVTCVPEVDEVEAEDAPWPGDKGVSSATTRIHRRA